MGTPSWAGPLATSLRGLWISGLLPPYNGGPCARAATRKPTRRGRLGPRAGSPKRSRPNFHKKRYSRTVLHQGEGPQRPQCVMVKGPKDPGVAAPLHLAQSLGHARVKARGVASGIGGMLRYASWLLAQGVGRMLCAAHDDRRLCRSLTIENCKLETRQNDVALEFIIASVDDQSWGKADLAASEISLEMHPTKTLHRKIDFSARMAWITSLNRSSRLPRWPRCSDGAR